MKSKPIQKKVKATSFQKERARKICAIFGCKLLEPELCEICNNALKLAMLGKKSLPKSKQ